MQKITEPLVNSIHSTYLDIMTYYEKQLKFTLTIGLEGFFII